MALRSTASCQVGSFVTCRAMRTTLAATSIGAALMGAVSMDGLTVDLGQIDEVTYDDEFVLIGEQMGARISAEEVAAERRTINYEVTTALRGRLPRLHIGA